MINNVEPHLPDLNHVPTNNNPNKPSLMMEKLRETVFKLASSKSNYPLTPSQAAFIEKGLLHTFSSHKTPTHPTYDWMIQHALADLDKEGSLTTEEIISEYMIKTYQGLPWAHKRYLKHHLDILCKNDELFCDIDGCYIHPDQKEQRSSRRKRLKRKFRGKREEDVVEEENVAREEVNELSDSQVGFQEEPSHGGLRRGKRQRRRSYVFDDEEEDEAVETRMVVEEMNRQKRSEMVVYETQNLVLLLKGREVECKSCETKNDDHGNVDIAEGKLEPQIDIECTNEVKNQVVQVDHVLSEGRKEPELSVLPANMMNILPVVTEGEVLNLDHSNDANVMLGTVESVTNPLASISNINNDATGSTVKKSLLVDRKSNPSVNELMIVPYVDNLLNSTIGKQMIPVSKSVNPIIVCGLPYKQPMTPKKFQVYRPKKLKPTKENAKALKDELVLASLNSSVQKSLMTKLKWKSQSPKPEGATLLEDVSVHKLQRHKSSHPVSFEIASIEDEEPLRQVMEKCGGWKKHGKQRTMLKVTSEDLASAEAVVQLPDELPSLENFVEKTPTVEKESALSHEKSYDYVGGDASRKSSSSFLEETGTKGSKRPDNQHPVIAQLATGCQRDCANVKHKQEQQTQDSCDLKRLTDNLDLKSKKSQIVGLESLSKEVSSSQCLDWIRGQAKKSELQINDHNSQATTAIILKLGTESVLDVDCPSLIEGSRLQLPNKPSDSKETTVEFPIPLQVEHHEGEEGLSEPTGHGSSGNQHSEQEKPHLLSQLFEYQKEENEGQGLHGIRHEDLKPPVPTFVRQQENKDQVRLFELTPENETHKHSDKPKTSQRKKRGRPRKPDQRTMKDATNSLNPQTLTHLSDHQKELAMEDALDPPTSQQHSKQKNKSVKQDAHVRTRKHKTTENDAVEPSDPNLMEQGQLSGAESSQNLQNQDKLPKKGGRKQLRKSKEPPPEAMDLYISYLQEQGLDPATGERLDQENKHLQEDGQEICLKQKEATEDAAILSNMQQKQGHRLDPTSGERLDQENKQLQEGQEVCWKQKEATEDAAILSNMQQKQGLSEPANCQRGRPSKKKKILTEEHLTASLKLNHQTDVGLSEPAKNQQSPRQNKEPRRGRSKIQKEGDKDNEAPRSSSHQELDGQCGGASDHHTGSENSQQRKAQSPEKGATKSGAATPLLQYPEQVELKSSSHVTPEASLKQSQVDLKESVPATSDHIDRANFEMSTLAASETSTCMADQSSQGDKDQSQPRRRTTRSSEAAKKNLDSQNVTHDLVSSDHQYPDKSEDSDIVVHGKPVELEQTELTSDIKSHRQSQKQKQHQQGRLSSSKPVTRLSVSQHDQELSEESHNQAKVEVQVKSPKEMSAKSASIRVPLSSKDQLRSRTKRQSQDSA